MMTYIWPALFGILGLFVGWGYFHAMRVSLTILTKSGVGIFVLMALARVLVFTAIAIVAVQTGIWSLATYMLAFMIVRTIMVSRAKLDKNPQAPKEKNGDG